MDESEVLRETGQAKWNQHGKIRASWDIIYRETEMEQ